jgi:hypothetical protein
MKPEGEGERGRHNIGPQIEEAAGLVTAAVSAASRTVWLREPSSKNAKARSAGGPSGPSSAQGSGGGSADQGRSLVSRRPDRFNA